MAQFYFGADSCKVAENRTTASAASNRGATNEAGTTLRMASAAPVSLPVLSPSIFVKVHSE